MGNCLKTQLKEEVSNVSLRKLNEIKFHINNSSNDIVGVYINNVGNTINARLEGTCHFTNLAGSEDKGSSISGTNGLTMYFSPGEADVFITGRYDFCGLQIDYDTRTKGNRIDIDFSELAYSVKNSVLDFGYAKNSMNVSGDLTNSDIKIYSFSLQYNSLLTGSLDKIVKNSDPVNSPSPAYTASKLMFPTTLLSLDLSSLNGKKFNNVSFSDYVTGDIKYIADTLDTNINISELAAPNITGSIENFVSRAIANTDRSTSTAKFNYTSPKNFTRVTYQGTSLSANSNVPTPTGSQQVSFSWDAQGNVTWSVA